MIIKLDARSATCVSGKRFPVLLNVRVFVSVLLPTLAATSTLDATFKAENGKPNMAGAALLGKMAAEKAKSANITEVVFDRSGFQYHGRVKAIAEAARENGLKF